MKLEESVHSWLYSVSYQTPLNYQNLSRILLLFFSWLLDVSRNNNKSTNLTWNWFETWFVEPECRQNSDLTDTRLSHRTTFIETALVNNWGISGTENLHYCWRTCPGICGWSGCTLQLTACCRPATSPCTWSRCLCSGRCPGRAWKPHKKLLFHSLYLVYTQEH